jgi:hypothetical protein
MLGKYVSGRVQERIMADASNPPTLDDGHGGRAAEMPAPDVWYYADPGTTFPDRG